jgi:biotin synthase
MSPEEIMVTARQVVSTGVKTIVLQSGEERKDIREICGIVEQIKKTLDCAVTLSIGEKTFSEYKDLKNAGADRYLLKFETSNEQLFKKLKPDSSYQARLKCLDILKQLGYQTGAGNIVGLPEQTIKILEEDILLLEKLNPDMVSITPFLPHPDTPLGKHPSGDLNLTLEMLSLGRIYVPTSHMPATTAIRTLHKEGTEKALMCGANVIMPNFTPYEYKKLYLIYPDKICLKENAEESIKDIYKLVTKLGRKISTGYGHSLKKRET